MNKAFTKEDDGTGAPEFRSRFQPLPPGFRNLITAAGAARLQDELAALVTKLAADPAPAGGSALSPEQTRQLLRLQIADLSARLDMHVIVPPATHAPDRVAFGSTVLVRDESGEERRYTLVGIDEADPGTGRISWTSPLGRALLNQPPGGTARLRTPSGDVDLDVIEVTSLLELP